MIKYLDVQIFLIFRIIGLRKVNLDLLQSRDSVTYLEFKLFVLRKTKFERLKFVFLNFESVAFRKTDLDF